MDQFTDHQRKNQMLEEEKATRQALKSGTPSTPKPSSEEYRCYLAGPMRGIKDFNLPAFNAAAKVLRAAGWDVFSPAERDTSDETLADAFSEEQLKNGDSHVPLSYFMQYDLAAVCNSSAVWVLPGWENSQGARLEVHVAWELGIDVYDYDTMKDIRPPEASNSSRAGLRAPDWGPETRSTDPETGSHKGRKEAVFANIPVGALAQIARVHGHGLAKYPEQEPGRPNWMRGCPWSWYYDAALRHILSFWSREELNEESGLQHLAHASWMLMALMEYQAKGLGTDDRPKGGA
jgi:hypothetical protein